MGEEKRDRILKKIVDDPMRLKRLIQSMDDLEFSRSALTLFREQWSPEDQYSRLEIRKLRCFESAMVTAFMRPFSKSKGGTTLAYKSIGISFSKKEQKLFKKIEHVRNKCVAHSDENMMHFRSAPIVLNSVKGILMPHINYSNAFHFTENELFTLDDLLYKILSEIRHAIFEITQTYPNEMEIYAKPKSG